MLPALFLTVLTFIQSFLPQPTLVEGVVGQPSYLNPVKSGTNQVDRDICRLVFNGLTAYNEKGEIVGDLAKKWEISPDGKNYTFFLKDDVFWHDGTPLTADDIIYTASQYPQLNNIAIDKLDTYTVRFNLPDPFAPFLDLVTLGVVPSHLAGKMDDLHPVGTGDFKFARMEKEDKIKRIILQGEGRRVTFKFYDSEEELLVASKLNEVDAFSLSFLPSPSERESLQVNYVVKEALLRGRYYAVFFNLSDNTTLLNDQLREDLAAATPKEEIINAVLEGRGEIASGPLDFFLNEEREDTYTEPVDPPAYEVKLSLTFPDTKLHRQTAQILSDAWRKLGVYLEFNPVVPGDIVSQIIDPKDFELLLLGQEVSQDPDRYTLWHSTQKDLPGLDFTSFENPRADKALEEGRKFWLSEDGEEPEEEKSDKEEVKAQLEDRKYHYRHFRDVFDEELPAIFLYYPSLFYVTKKNILPLELDFLHTPSDRFHILSLHRL